MAEKKPAASIKRRIVKNPETFRERAIKASEQSDKPTRRTKVSGLRSKILGPIFRPIVKLFKTLGKLKFFRIIGLILVPPYVRNSWKELRQVTWPTPRQSRKLTVAVLIFALIFGVVIALVDYGLDKLFRNILIK